MPDIERAKALLRRLISDNLTTCKECKGYGEIACGGTIEDPKTYICPACAGGGKDWKEAPEDIAQLALDALEQE